MTTTPAPPPQVDKPAARPGGQPPPYEFWSWGEILRGLVAPFRWPLLPLTVVGLLASAAWIGGVSQPPPRMVMLERFLTTAAITASGAAIVRAFVQDHVRWLLIVLRALLLYVVVLVVMLAVQALR